MTVDISVLIGGEAGQGIQTVGLLMARTCHRAGLYVMAVNDFESRIRGGHSFIQLRISDRPVHGPARKLHMIVALDERTYGLHESELTEGGLALIPKDNADTMTQHHRCKMVDFEGVAKKAGSGILANTVAAGTCLALLGAPFDLFKKVLKLRHSTRWKKNASHRMFKRPNMDTLPQRTRPSNGHGPGR